MSRFYVLLLLSTLSFISLNVFADGYTHVREINLKPSLGPSLPYHPKKLNPKENSDVVRMLINYYACFSAYDGTPLNCSFKQSILGLKEPWDDAENNSGHDGSAHDWRNGHFVYRSKLDGYAARHIFFEGDSNPDRLIVEGTTISSDTIKDAVVYHELPKISGKIVQETTVTAPRYWLCSENCYTRTTTRYLTTYDIGVHDLVKLPERDANSGYVRVRSPDIQHSFEEAYYGLPTTVEALKLISENYNFLSDTLLSVNDMSLRKGGVFDIKGEFLTPHETHQEGKDVDINVGDVECIDDRNLFIAVDTILPPVDYEKYNPFYTGESIKPSAVNCEGIIKDNIYWGGVLKHLDFEIGYKEYIGKGHFY